MTEPAPSAPLEDRYGRRPARTRLTSRGWLWAAVLATLLAGAFVAWIVLAGQGRPEFKDVSFEVVDSGRATADFDLTKPEDATVVCAVQALNEQYAVVGWEEIVVGAVPADQRRGDTSTHRVSLRTTNLATSAGVNSCWTVD